MDDGTCGSNALASDQDLSTGTHYGTIVVGYRISMGQTRGQRDHQDHSQCPLHRFELERVWEKEKGKLN